MKLVSIRTVIMTAAAAVVAGTASAHPGHDHTYANHNILEMPPLDAGQMVMSGLALAFLGLAILGIVFSARSRDN